MYKSESVDVDVEIELEDVIEFIEDYSTPKDRKQIINALTGLELPIDTQLEGSMVKGMKTELLILAANKYSLEELEQRLGTKFDLI